MAEYSQILLDELQNNFNLLDRNLEDFTLFFKLQINLICFHNQIILQEEAIFISYFDIFLSS